MVEDRITDPVRVAQLLSSELAGRGDGPLGDVAVVDADRDAEPTPEGTVAYGVTVGDERVGDVVLYPDVVAVAFVPRDPERVVAATRGGGVTVRRKSGDRVEGDGDHCQREHGWDSERARSGAVVVRIEYAAAVKRAVDAFVAGFER